MRPAERRKSARSAGIGGCCWLHFEAHGCKRSGREHCGAGPWQRIGRFMSHHYPAPNFEPQQGEPSLNLADRRALPNVDRRAVMELLGPPAAEPFGLGALYVDEVRPCLNHDFRTDVLRG